MVANKLTKDNPIVLYGFILLQRICQDQTSFYYLLIFGLLHVAEQKTYLNNRGQGVSKLKRNFWQYFVFWRFLWKSFGPMCSWVKSEVVELEKWGGDDYFGANVWKLGGKAVQGRAHWPLHPSSNNCRLVIELHTSGNQTWRDLTPITQDMAVLWRTSILTALLSVPKMVLPVF